MWQCAGDKFERCFTVENLIYNMNWSSDDAYKSMQLWPRVNFTCQPETLKSEFGIVEKS